MAREVIRPWTGSPWKTPSIPRFEIWPLMEQMRRSSIWSTSRGVVVSSDTNMKQGNLGYRVICLPCTRPITVCGLASLLNRKGSMT